ncbi:hypothetical protein [Cellulomonas aerilata]|uniref:AraC-type arabinose-binding/dimerisation domain-containing protein n=1 Tax=Cellulomonas aerilata TaxID=515326 RepID=A0A512D9J1_9CELL|nr:hypothetical protein [Cellulomonas aerilata]GEO33146.1 hypothetical protein CAE01nite_08710 [Cellulomonas aerilata]
METERSPACGLVVLEVPAGMTGRRVRAPGADVVLAVLSGGIRVALGQDTARPVTAPGWVVCPRGDPWRLAADGAAARVLVVACPAGPEALVEALAQGLLDDALLVAVAHDAGVELLLDATSPECRAGVRGE